MSEMYIVNHIGDKTNHVLKIPYRGYEISFTTVSRHPEIMVFSETSESLYVTYDVTYEGILSAMRFIDYYISDKEK
jgi:hypothetical protein